MKVAIRRVAPNTHDIYTRWGVMDPILEIQRLLGIILDGKLDDKHRVNKEINPSQYTYLLSGKKDDKEYSIEINIQEKDTNLAAMMNCNKEWCKRMLVAVKESIPS